MKKIEWPAQSVFLTALLLTLNPAAAQTNFITIGTGSTSGLYYAVGQSLCAASLKQQSQGKTRCYAVNTEGSAFNIKEVLRGSLMFGLAQSDTQYDAVKGQGGFKQAQTELRSIVSLYTEPLVVMVQANSNVRKFAALKGQRINIGPVGSGQYTTGLRIFDALGFSSQDRINVSNLGSDKHGAALCSGRIDAFIFSVGHPASNISVPAEDCKAQLLPIDAELIKVMMAKYPQYAPALIPANTYKNNPVDTPTFGPLATLITSNEQPEAVVYQFTHALFEQIDLLKRTHPSLINLDNKSMISRGLSAPLHPGAVRYYRERGWLK